MRSNPPTSRNLAGKNSSNSERATNHKVPAMSTSRVPVPLTSRCRLRTSSQSPSLLKVNPEPSRNPFCQARDFGGLHVESPNQQARLPTSNFSQLTQSSQDQNPLPDNRTKYKTTKCMNLPRPRGSIHRTARPKSKNLSH